MFSRRTQAVEGRPRTPHDGAVLTITTSSARTQWSRAIGLGLGAMGLCGVLSIRGEAQAAIFVDGSAVAGITAENVSGNTQRYIVESIMGGSAFFDYDADGDADLYVTDGSTLDGMTRGLKPTNRLYRNDHGTFADVTVRTGTGDTSWSMGCVVADYDNDGDDDLYVTNYGGNKLYRNQGGTKGFDEVGAWAGVGDLNWSTGCTFGDYDLDGDVDLYVANYIDFSVDTPPPCQWKNLDVYCGPRGLLPARDVLYRNDGDGTFVDHTTAMGFDKELYGMGATFADLDDDGWPDLFVANDTTPNLLYGNSSGVLEEMALMAGVAYNGEGVIQGCMGVGASMPTSRIHGSFTLSPGLLADVNQDGSVTSADAILVLRFAVGLIGLDEIQLVLADVNRDGNINAGDAVLTLRKAVGLIPKPVAAWSPPRLAWGTPETVEAGEAVVPLLFEGDLYGGDFVVRYDGATWQPTGIRVPGQNAIWAMGSDTPGTFRFTVASTDPLERLELVLEGASGMPSLTLEEALVVDGAGRPVAARMSLVETQVSILPGRYALMQNYPNPFNPQTHITYHVPGSEAVRLQLYALTGQPIRTLVDGVVSGGAHTVVWDGRDASGEPVGSGVYLVRLEAGDFIDSRRMMLLR